LGVNRLIECPGPLPRLTMMDTNVAIIAAGTTPRGEGEGEEGAVALSGQ
jgi:hypothetical protein